MKVFICLSIALLALTSCGSTKVSSPSMPATAQAIYSIPESDLASQKDLIDRILQGGKMLSEDPELMALAKESMDKALSDNYMNSLGIYDPTVISIDEKIACVAVGLVECYTARIMSVTAVNDARGIRFWWLDYADGNEGNAYQHAFWNALMDKTLGSFKASLIATAHETGHPMGPDSPAGYGSVWSEMDLFNNDIGRSYGFRTTFMSTSAIGDLVYADDEAGKLKIVDPRTLTLVPSNKNAPWFDEL